MSAAARTGVKPFVQALSRRGSSFYSSELDDFDEAIPLTEEAPPGMWSA